MSAPADVVRQRLESRNATTPTLDAGSAALNGLAGDVVRALEPHTEADPVSLLLNVLTQFGAMVGRHALTRVGAAMHPPATYLALVGRTSRSRKGTSTVEVARIMSLVEDTWMEQHRIGGFGSGEAFIEHCAEAPGESVLMIEAELARLLAVASREGSSASSVLRSAWDFQPMDYRIRRKKYEAPAAPVSMIAHITVDELRDGRHGIRMNDVMNGFGNRNLWTYVDRRKVLANPSLPEGSTITELTTRLRRSLEVARGAGTVQRTEEAETLWSDLYERLSTDDPSGSIGAVTGRAEAQVVRLSLIYALLDASPVIERTHLESAWEVWRYCRWSAQHIWVGPGTGDPDVDRIAAVLSDGEELSARDLDRMFLGHRSTIELRQKAIDYGIAVEVKEPTAGRPRTLLRAADKADKADKLPVRWWIAPTFTASSASSAGEYQSAEPGYRQIQREAGEDPETDEALAFLRLQRVVDELKQEAAGGA